MVLERVDIEMRVFLNIFSIEVECLEKAKVGFPGVLEVALEGVVHEEVGEEGEEPLVVLVLIGADFNSF